MSSHSLAPSPRPQAPPAPLPAFRGCGIELEYVLVHEDSLDVQPIADSALRTLAVESTPVSHVRRGLFGWSNELALHVLELKNEDPTVPMELLAGRFQHELRQMNEALRQYRACLMPSGMHPWMDPRRETQLWPHQQTSIYRLYDRIFDCRTHGYANLQSMHVNLPFADEREFVRLHAAIRLLLPILPALAASSPYAEGNRSHALDFRMCVYATNACGIAEVTGAVVPEDCYGCEDYRARILAPLYRAIAPHDPEGMLQHEWLNARGAIARFERSAIEIRVLDTQECPRMDVAIAALAVDLLQALYERRLGDLDRSLATERLARILQQCVREGEAAQIDDERYLQALGVARPRLRADALWSELAARLIALDAPRTQLWQQPLDHILVHGTLARRLVTALGPTPSRRRLRSVYGALCEALAAGEAFR